MPLTAGVVNTVILSDGGPGPYLLGSEFVDSCSITVKCQDSSFVPPWVYIPDNNAILFSDMIDSGKVLLISYNTTNYGLPKIYSLFPKIRLKTREAQPGQDRSRPKVLISKENENLSVSGYKSISVAAGNFGQISLEQGLDVEIGGELRPGTQLKAHFTDQGSTLDGATREISEFDMIYVTLNDPKFDVVAGDQFIQWPIDGIISGQKKIKGLSISVHPGPFTANVFGALTGGNFTTETWHGKNGLQGPYTFSGKGEQGIITPIGGTVKIKLNGKYLEEGEDKDFTVDYDLGSATFKPKVPIRDNDLIIVEYEYKLFDYQRILAGGSAGFSTSDSIFTVQGAMWSEADNKNHPIDISLDSSDIDQLRRAGDQTVYGYNYRAVHENDVPVVSGYEPLYEKVDSLGRTFFRYKPFDPKYPEDRSGRYRVYFSYAGKNKGTYIRDTSVSGQQVYKYVNDTIGDYVPRTELPTPKRLTVGEITSQLNLNLLKVKVNVAGQDYDRNLYSSLDDDDDRGSAVTSSVIIGKKDLENRSLWLSADYNFLSRYFQGQHLDTYDKFERWDDSSSNVQNVEHQFWESYFGITPFKLISAEAGYGQSRNNSYLVTDKYFWYSRIKPSEKLLLDYNGTYFRHYDKHRLERNNRKDIARVLYKKQKHCLELTFKDEWQADSAKMGYGLISGLLNYEFIPWNLHQSFEFRQFRSGDAGIFNATDTGWAFIWDQSINHQLFDWWKVDGMSSLFITETNTSGVTKNESSINFLVDINSHLNFRNTGLSSQQHYHLSSEKISSVIQVPVLTVKGLGTHVYNDSLREYVPQINGDYLLLQREVYDSTDGRARKKRFDLAWSWDPVKKISGILNDLSWQGTLILEEHSDYQLKGLEGYLPGIISLKDIKTPFSNNKVTYADLSYRQEIFWVPEEEKTANGELSVALSLRKIRSYQETAVETGFGFERRFGKLTLRNDSKYGYVFHNDSLVQDFYIRDLNTVFSQSVKLNDAFDIYLRECVGWARKDDPTTKDKSLDLDSCIYVQLNPGVQFKPFSIGLAEASYLLSYVPVPGDLDYRMARGLSSGLSHIISVTAAFQVGKHFSVSGTYRSEIRKLPGNSDYEKGEHSVVMEMKAFL